MSGTMQSRYATRRVAAEATKAQAGAADSCRQAVIDGYPCLTGSPSDVLLADFARQFAANGAPDQIFSHQLRPCANRSGGTSKSQAVAGAAPPISLSELAQFPCAAAIRELFSWGGPQPSVRFDSIPETLDAGVRHVALQLTGTTMSCPHGPQRSTAVRWSGADGSNSARLVFDPQPSNATGVLHANGPGALFRRAGVKKPQSR
jgi:type VI secretion system protein ImpL